MSTAFKIIDGDGHIFERDEEINPYLDPKYQSEDGFKNASFFPGIDGWRRGSAGGHVDATAWTAFLDQAQMAGTFLYPTTALGFGFARDPQWSAVLARAYNDHVADLYLKRDPRLKAVALLPVLDPGVAADELRRAVGELGMSGGLLPAVGLRQAYGESVFDPIYEAAQSLWRTRKPTSASSSGPPGEGATCERVISSSRTRITLSSRFRATTPCPGMTCSYGRYLWTTRTPIIFRSAAARSAARPASASETRFLPCRATALTTITPKS
ncbi:MAG TPA: amidohydrolase family protein [Chloroflexota bacterium]|nr:amidohydrolase family protein [Chloroflexota bacterium]